MTFSLLDRIGKTVFATMSRVKIAELSKYGSHDDARTIPVDVLLDAEIAAGSPMVTRLLAEMQGYKLVPIDSAPPSTGAATFEDVLRVVKEFSDVTATYLDAKADGVIDLRDRQNLLREIDEAEAFLLAFRKKI
jgi:hypothetical protein